MKSSREQFEEWAKSSGSDMERYKTGINKGDFKNPVMRKMWLAWQASRAAIEIELPDKVMVEDEFDNGHNCAIDYCADAIHAAGLTVKGDA